MIGKIFQQIFTIYTLTWEIIGRSSKREIYLLENDQGEIKNISRFTLINNYVEVDR